MEAKYKEKKVVVPEERKLTSTYTSLKYSNEKELLKEASYCLGKKFFSLSFII